MDRIKAQSLAGAWVKDLIADAEKSKTAHEMYDVLDGFRRLATRDTSRGGGPLGQDDLLMLEIVEARPTLADVLKKTAKEPPYRRERAALTLLDLTGNDPTLFLVYPDEAQH